ncbi:hypothetical protein CVT26_005638 [Gymnopilus dilepis]|uniref:CxC2-like cysteine cluster KDZ transposase-associated domain-containing protein n=1 Tax=Gymnopilus dilepis TaxID=231916 RepID=A0A409XZX7_9AGAR|nr:hypothetical protein CVT26_005638 [Gymnopilus dilepis]
MPPKSKRFTGPTAQQPKRFIRSDEKQTSRGLVTSTTSLGIDPRPAPRAVPNAGATSTATAGIDAIHQNSSTSDAMEEDLTVFNDIGSEREQRKTKTQTNYLQEYLQRQPHILKCLMARYARQQEVCTTCQQYSGQWRCRDCSNNNVLCRGCMRQSHQNLPFHAIEFWTGQFFTRSSLARVGVRLVLAHGSGTCDRLRQRLKDIEEFERLEDLRTSAPVPRPPASTEAGASIDTTQDSMEIDDLPELRDLEDDERSDYGDDFDQTFSTEDYSGGHATSTFDNGPEKDIGTVNSNPDALLEDEDDWEDEDISAPFEHDKAHIDDVTDDAFGNPIITVIHSNGFHALPAVQCNCEGPGFALDEFIGAGLLPASYDKIKTVATFQCLEDFRLCNLEAKTTAYQYHNLLRRRSNPSAPNTTVDRYQILQRLSREWRSLKKLKFHGFADAPDRPAVGDLALFCPTCPQEGVNLPDNWRDLGPSHLYNRLFVADGNFTADHMKLKGDAADVWLVDGQGMMAEKAPYERHLGIAKDMPTDAPCERNFRAVNLANMVSSTADVTGQSNRINRIHRIRELPKPDRMGWDAGWDGMGWDGNHGMSTFFWIYSFRLCVVDPAFSPSLHHPSSLRRGFRPSLQRGCGPLQDEQG